MKDIVINQIIIPLLVAVIGTIIEIGRRQLKKYLDSKEELIVKQKEALQLSMGIEQYNKDKQIVQDVIKAVEQIGRENDWTGTLKHTKVLDMVTGKTGLTDEQIFNIIKGTVAEFNINKATTSAAQNTTNNIK